MDAQKIGEFIKELRKEKNLTQKELAEILNCTDKAVSRWETGRGIPEISMLIPLSKELGVSVNELLMGERFEKEEIEEKTEQLIVETITATDKKVGGLKKVIYALFCLIEVLILYAIPITAKPGDEMGVVFGIILLTAVNAFLLGLTNVKVSHKCIFAVITAVMFAPTVWVIPIYGTWDFTGMCLYMLFYWFIATVFALLGTAINKAVRYVMEKVGTR